MDIVTRRNKTQSVFGIISIILCVIAASFNPVSTHALSLSDITDTTPSIDQPIQPVQDASIVTNSIISQTQSTNTLSPVGDIVSPVLSPVLTQQDPQIQDSQSQAPASPLPIQTSIQVAPIISTPVTSQTPAVPPKVIKPQTTTKSTPTQTVAPTQSYMSQPANSQHEKNVVPPANAIVTSVQSKQPAEVIKGQATIQSDFMAKYMSGRISAEERNNLYKFSAGIALGGMMLFLLTLQSVRDLIGLQDKSKHALAAHN